MNTMKEWNRICTSCNTNITYASYSGWYKADRWNRNCKSCSIAKINRNRTADDLSNRNQNIRKSKLGTSASVETKLKMSKSQTGRRHSLETKRKISEWHKGKILSDTHRQNLRLAKIADMKKKHGQISPNYNSDACRLIEKYGKKHGYNFQHAENGGEFHIKPLGYWVDGYDAEQNLVIEVYESYHSRQIEKDKIRQKEIEEHLGCEFVILNI